MFGPCLRSSRKDNSLWAREVLPGACLGNPGGWDWVLFCSEGGCGAWWRPTVVCDHSMGDQGELAGPGTTVTYGLEAGGRDLFPLLWVSDYLGVHLNTSIAVKLHKTCSPTYSASALQPDFVPGVMLGATGEAGRQVGYLSWEPAVGVGEQVEKACWGQWGTLTLVKGGVFLLSALPGLLESSLGCVGEVSLGSGSRDHERAELARPTDLGFSCLPPPSWPPPRNAQNIKPTLFSECSGA